jgi:N-acetylglucosamine-6-phosphate deacetylase
LHDDGVDKIMATIITEHVDVMSARLARLVELRDRDPLAEEVIAGFHIEGPFINERLGYRGAHPEDAIIPADPDVMKRLLEAASGLTRIVTLAPERDSGFKTTRSLSGLGITVSASHCDPTQDELLTAIDAGLSMFTHLDNGCPMQLNRQADSIPKRNTG